MHGHSHSNAVALLGREPRDHTAYLYTDSGALCDAVAWCVQGAVERGSGAVMIATEEHAHGVLLRLERRGLDGRELLASERLVRLDAERTLERVMNGREPDGAAFGEVVRGAVGPVLARFPGLCAYGELVDLLLQGGNAGAVERIEGWWNALIEEAGFSLLCGYRADAAGPEAAMVCRAHTRVMAEGEGHERFERAVIEALAESFEDPAAMLRLLTDRYRGAAGLSRSHAALIALQEMLPWVAERVRMRVRAIYAQERASGEGGGGAGPIA